MIERSIRRLIHDQTFKDDDIFETEGWHSGQASQKVSRQAG
jgi:hypothetical protein